MRIGRARNSLSAWIYANFDITIYGLERISFNNRNCLLGKEGDCWLLGKRLEEDEVAWLNKGGYCYVLFD